MAFELFRELRILEAQDNQWSRSATMNKPAMVSLGDDSHENDPLSSLRKRTMLAQEEMDKKKSKTVVTTTTVDAAPLVDETHANV
jgi:hypothetical protein